MKTNIIIIGLIGLLCMTQSCTQLEDRNYKDVVLDQFDPSTEDLVSMLGAAYVPWRETLLGWNGVARAQMLPADQDVIPARPNGWVDGGIYKRMHQHNWTSEEDICVQSWERTYGGINACNRMLDQIESGVLTVPTEQEKVSLIAELKILRASYYYILVDLFGNVPLVTKFDVPEGYLPEQSKRVEIYEFIINEILENIDNLATTTSREYYGRFTQWGAYSLLAKMYLNAQVFSDGTYIEWQKCIEACDKVINSGNYRLEDEQRLVFITNNEESKEIIMALPFNEIFVTDWNAFDFHMYTLQSENQATYNFTDAPWGGICCIPQYIDSFDDEDARLKNGFIYGQQYTLSGDMLYSEGRPLAYINEVPGIDESNGWHGYRWGKFEYAIGITNRLSNDWPLFRYADILLMKAEALLRNGQGEAAAELVTEVRNRNFKENPGKAKVTAQDLMSGSTYDYGRRDNIVAPTYEGGDDIEFGRFLDELGWEFSQEGRRRQDMVRFGAFTTKSWFSHDKSEEYRNLYPIPQGQLLTNGNLKQNPGY